MTANRPIDRRALRKRGLLRLVDAELSEATAWVDRNTARRLRADQRGRRDRVRPRRLPVRDRCRAGAGGADPALYCSVYLAGGVFFSTGGYATVLQAINGPREVGGDGRFLPRDWHWWASEPDRIEWMSSFALFFGTIVFAINIVDSFVAGPWRRRRESPRLVARRHRLPAVPDRGIPGDAGNRPRPAVLEPAPRPGLVDRRRQPARLGPLHGRRRRLVRQALERRRAGRRHRQLGHARRGALLRGGRSGAGVRASGCLAQPSAASGWRTRKRPSPYIRVS